MFQPIPAARGAARSVLAAALLAAIAGAPPAAGQSPEPPPYYAIQDAQVAVGDGRVLDRATVLVADGLIEAVGVDLDIPADAWVVDGEGLTVYPGLIDAMGTLGLRREAEGGGGGGPGGPPGRDPGPQIRGPEDRPNTTPWRDAADLLDADPKVESWREAGFTAALTAPEDGFFAGQAALIHLGESEPKDRVLASGLAQRVNFEGAGGFRRFPGSLMGVLAYVEQVLIDARHQSAAEALYLRSPQGRERPAYDRALAPIQTSLEDRRPFLMPGSWGREIDRVVRMAKAHDLEAILYGGHGAYGRVDELRDHGIPVLLDIDWPTAEKDRDPDAETPFRDLVHRRMARATPGLLAEAGVPFAFSTGGLTSPSKVFANLREALDAGLSEGDALRAMTLGAAEILGVGARLGSVEAGKIANLVLADAPPWAEGVEIAAVVVDGHLYRQRGDDEDAEPPAADVSGTWSLVLQSPRGNVDLDLELEMEDDGKVTGELRSERGPTSIEKGRMAGDRLTFESTRTMGPRSFEVSYSLAVDGEQIDGTASAGPMTMDLSGERTARPSGDGPSDDAQASEGDDAPTLDELRTAMAAYQGPARDVGSFAVIGAQVWTVSGETLDGATVVVRDGKIAAVGVDVEVPAGLEVFDAEGGALIPGIVDAHSHIAVDGQVNEGTLAVTSMVTIDDVIDPDDIAIYRALAGGVTTINVLHGSANPIGGGNAVLKMRWGQNADGMRFDGAPPGIKFALGENPKRSRLPAGFPQRYPVTRMGVMDVVRQSFAEAAAYRDAWQTYGEQRAALTVGRKRGSAGDGASDLLPPRRDLELERLAEVLDGTRLVHAHCYRADEILQLLQLAEEFGFKIATLQHVLEGYKVADEIAAYGAGASTFSDWWGFKVEANDAIPHNAAVMVDRGVLVSINSDSGEEMRHLNQEAAKAVKWGGLDERTALALVTLNPAKQLGIDDRVGSIEVGKDADLVLYDGHPLSLRSVVLKTFIDGDLYFDRGADRERQATVDALKVRLEPEGEGDTENDHTDGGDAEPPSEPEWKAMTYSCRGTGHDH
ncbi:MAG: amidohydrolase family protein [Acidobacteriota bacterium]